MHDPKKLKLIEELISHLEGSQGNDLGALVEESRKPKMDMSSGDSEVDEFGKPKGVAIEKVSVMKPEGDSDAALEKGMPELGSAGMADKPMGDSGDEMSDEELAELLKKYL